jgi:putative transposase
LTDSRSWSVIAKFTASFDAVFAAPASQCCVVHLVRRRPTPERWVSIIRRECLDRMLIVGERQLQVAAQSAAAGHTIHGSG